MGRFDEPTDDGELDLPLEDEYDDDDAPPMW